MYQYPFFSRSSFPQCIQLVVPHAPFGAIHFPELLQSGSQSSSSAIGKTLLTLVNKHTPHSCFSDGTLQKEAYFVDTIFDFYRWIQPAQQHGRRLPSFSSARVLVIRWLRVSGFLAEITQQIHSLRASGVISSHAASVAEEERKALRKSTGTLCTAPVAMFIRVLYKKSPRMNYVCFDIYRISFIQAILLQCL